MKNFIKVSNATNTTTHGQKFSKFSINKLEKMQMRKIKGGNDGGGDGDTSIVTEDVVDG